MGFSVRLLTHRLCGCASIGYSAVGLTSAAIKLSEARVRSKHSTLLVLKAAVPASVAPERDVLYLASHIYP